MAPPGDEGRSLEECTFTNRVLRAENAALAREVERLQYANDELRNRVAMMQTQLDEMTEAMAGAER